MKEKKNENKAISGMTSVIDFINENGETNQRAPRLYIIFNEIIRSSKITYTEAIGMLELLKGSLVQEHLNKMNEKKLLDENKVAMRDYVG